MLGLSGCAAGSAPEFNITGSTGYILTTSEQHWNCGGLENAIQVRVNTLTSLNAQVRRESQTAPPTVSRLFTRMLDGPGMDSPAVASLKTERAAADAYNATLKQKGCQTINIDDRLAKASPPPVVDTDLHAKPTGIKPLEPPKGI